MRKLNAAIERFAYNHPRFGIPGLMRFIIGGNIALYLLYLFTGRNFSLLSFLTFDLYHLLHGEVWRLVTFAFMPFSFSPISLVIMLSFYYFVGGMLEREWGRAKFSLYYFSGMALSLLATVLSSLITGNYLLTLSGTYYINLAMFMAFAVLYPDARIMLYFVIPLKAKWLAIADVVLFAWSFLQALLAGSLAGALAPVVALLNFIVFFWPEIVELVGGSRQRARHVNSHQTIQFKSAVRAQKKKESAQGYRQKCEVCGRTDTDFPDLEFRYCSRCEGYHCFCADHIFNHQHFTAK